MKYLLAIMITLILTQQLMAQDNMIHIQLDRKELGRVTGDFIVEDELGRRTGWDHITNKKLREIPNVHYGQQGLDGHEGGPGVSWVEWFMPVAIPGTYKITVIGTSSDSCVLNIQMARSGDETTIFNFDVGTYPGQITEYEIFYDPDITVPLTAKLITGINTFSVFATHSIWLKRDSEIISGNIAVNASGAPPFLDSKVELVVEQKATTPSGVELKAHRIKVKKKAVVNSDVFYNQLTNNGTINGTQNTPLTLPLFSTLPTFQSAPAGTQNITVAKNDSISLSPGDYGDIKVKKKGIVHFTGGIYNVRSLNFGNDTKMFFGGASEVRIEKKFETGKKTYVGPQNTTTISAKDIVFYVVGMNGKTGKTGKTGKKGASPKSAKVGSNNTVFANFYVPNGTLWLRQKSVVEGAVIGKDVSVGKSVKVTLDSAF